MSFLSPFFFDSLPSFFKINDSNKDPQGRGSLERYIKVFEEDSIIRVGYISSALSENFVVPPLDFLPFPGTTSPKTLHHLASGLGHPPDTFERDDLYRLLLKDVQKVHRYKGSLEGLKRFFLTISIEIQDLELTYPGEALYDTGILYDSGELYDTGTNSFCVGYSLNFIDPLFIIPVATPERARLQILNILEYMLPVNLVLLEVKVNGSIL